MTQRSAPDPIAYGGLPAASQASGVSVRQLARDVASGALVSFKLGRKRLVFRQDLENYLRQRAPPKTADQSLDREEKPPTGTRPLDG
jgi:hypothetical protein